jgi:hypothetical protein
MNAGCLQFVVEEDWSDGSESEMKPIMASHSLSQHTRTDFTTRKQF